MRQFFQRFRIVSRLKRRLMRVSDTADRAALEVGELRARFDASSAERLDKVFASIDVLKHDVTQGKIDTLEVERRLAELLEKIHHLVGRVDFATQSFAEFTGGGVAEVLDFRFQSFANEQLLRQQSLEAGLREELASLAARHQELENCYKCMLASLPNKAAANEPNAPEGVAVDHFEWAMKKARPVLPDTPLVDKNLGLNGGIRQPSPFLSSAPRVAAHSIALRNQVVEEWSLLVPRSLLSKPLVRVGRMGDGGYVTVDDFENIDACISAGVDTELSWDLGLANRGIRVFMFDPAVADIPCRHPNMLFERLAVVADTNGLSDEFTVKQILERNGLSRSESMILKVDIEGNEWALLEQSTELCLNQFSHIIFEFHGMCNYSDHAAHLMRLYALKALSETHQIVHLHANNWAGFEIVGGLGIPDVIETTWVRRRDSMFGEPILNVPNELDCPNNADRAELCFSLQPFLRAVSQAA